MHTERLDITGTRAATGCALRRFYFGPISYIVYAFVLLPFILLSLAESDPGILLVPVFLVGGALLVVKLYIREAFEDETRTLPSEVPACERLSLTCVRYLPSMRDMTLLSLLDAALRSPRGRFIVEEMGLQPTAVRANILDKMESFPLSLNEFLSLADTARAELGEQRISPSALLLVLFRSIETFRPILDSCDLSVEEFRLLLKWESFHDQWSHYTSALSPSSIISEFGGVGRSWVMGYTDALDFLTIDLSRCCAHSRRRVHIHEKEIDDVVHLVSQGGGRNILLIGRVGVGKRTLIENLSCRLRAHECERHLPFTRVLRLRTEELLSGIQNPDAFFLRALKKAEEAGKFLLVIEELPLFLRAGGEHLKAVLMKFLRSSFIQVVGIASTEDYHTHIKTDPVFDSLFEKLPVPEASDDETMRVLMEYYFRAARRGGPRVTYKALRSVLMLCKRYLGKGALPGKAIDVLHDSMLLAGQWHEPFVREDHVREVISRKAHMNIQKLGQDERERLQKLEGSLKHSIVGQQEAISALVNALKRARLDMSAGRKPFGTFLLLGPTGVGKTHTAKVLAEEYFGSAESLVRLDMNEFSTEESIRGIIGDANLAGGGEGFLSRTVQDRPFSLILLDEVEKAHTKVLHLFLQVLDEGFLTDSRGVRTDFRNTIIIATSNAGALFIRNYLKQHGSFQQSSFKDALIEDILQQKLFSPEFLNRFDATLVYYPLTADEAFQVAELMLGGIVREFQDARGIQLQIEEEALQTIVGRGYSLEFGAREMRRAIIETLENYLADYLLAHDVKRGSTITITKGELRL